jgi:hypothetical protein
MGFAPGIRGEKIRPGSHQFLLELGGCAPVDDRLGVQMPALAALGHA